MKSDDLERLEESQGIQELIRSAKEQYEQEKSVQPPAPYPAFAQVLKEKHGAGKRPGISPWWLVAACLLGCIIGYGFADNSHESGTNADRFTRTDTVVIVHERVDTVYREVRIPSQTLIASQAASESSGKTGSPEKPVRVPQGQCSKEQVRPVFVSLEFLQQQQNLPDPNNECYVANGMTVAEGKYPLHLLAAMSGR